MVSIVGWAVGIQKYPDAPILLIHCQDVKKIPQPSGVRSWITTPSPVSAPPVPVLGASTVAHTSQGSPSIDVLPPSGGVVLADVDSAGVNSESESQGSDRSRRTIDSSRMGVSSNSVYSAGLSFSASILRIDGSCVLHPFTPHKLDVGPIRLLTIAHAFNYRMAVLRDGVKSAVRIGCSRKAEGRFLTDTDISWGLQVAAIFKIMSMMALELPSFLETLGGIRGISPDVQLGCEPWGHVDHSDGHCYCRSSDRAAAYVHELALMSRDLAVPSSSGRAVTRSAGTSARSAVEPCLVLGRPGGAVSFVSDRPCAYGRLLLAVYVQWKSGVLVPSDWLRPVRRGGWRTGVPEHVRGLDDVS